MTELAELSLLAQAAAQTTVSDTDPGMALRVRNWFVEAWSSRLWVDYRREAEEDEGFYEGGDGQWSVDGTTSDLERLRRLNRAHVSINEVQSVVDILTGFEQQNRFDLKAAPQGQEDDEDAQLFTWLLKDVQEKCAVHDLNSEVFEDELIRGLGAAEVGIDWTQDPARPQIVVERLEPGWELIWDPECVDWRQFRDCRYMIRFKSAYLEDLIAQYPQHADAIRQAAERIDLQGWPEGGGRSTDNSSESPADAYGPVGGSVRDPLLQQMFWDPKARKALLLEAWYETFQSRWIVTNKVSGEVYEAESAEAARQTAAADPDRLTAVRKLQRLVRMAVVLPATGQTLEQDVTPYENDSQDYPFAVAYGKRKRNKIYGIVRNLKDPQRVMNKRESQLLDVIIQYGNMRPMYEEGAVANPALLKDQWSTEPVSYRPGHQPPTWYAPPLGDLFRVLTLEADRHKLFMRDASGVNMDLLGARENVASGIAIARQQAQGQIIATVWFTHFRAYKKQLGLRLARRIQQLYTYEQVLRLTNDLGEPVLLRLNAADYQGKSPEEIARLKASETDRRRQVLRDVKALEYDIVISEAPTTPTMRSMSLLAILEILRTAPALTAVFMDKIVELADMPDKAELLRRVRAIQQAQGIVPSSHVGPPQAGPPGPAGVPAQGQPGMAIVSPETQAGTPVV